MYSSRHRKEFVTRKYVRKYRRSIFQIGYRTTVDTITCRIRATLKAGHGVKTL